MQPFFSGAKNSGSCLKSSQKILVCVCNLFLVSFSVNAVVNRKEEEEKEKVVCLHDKQLLYH